jgi:nuclear pore complex protein Nup205
MSENPNISHIDCFEVTIAEFHQRRRDLGECLQYLVEAAEAAEAPDASPTLSRVADFVHGELLTPSTTHGGETLALRIFKETETLDDILGKADSARRGASSYTTLPSGQGE